VPDVNLAGAKNRTSTIKTGSIGSALYCLSGLGFGRLAAAAWLNRPKGQEYAWNSSQGLRLSGFY